MGILSGRFISVEEQPGCIASLIGLTSTHYNYHVISFRRPRTAESDYQQSVNESSHQYDGENTEPLEEEIDAPIQSEKNLYF